MKICCFLWLTLPAMPRPIWIIPDTCHLTEPLLVQPPKLFFHPQLCTLAIWISGKWPNVAHKTSQLSVISICEYLAGVLWVILIWVWLAFFQKRIEVFISKRALFEANFANPMMPWMLWLTHVLTSKVSYYMIEVVRQDCGKVARRLHRFHICKTKQRTM